MKLTIHNFAKISHAEIQLDGLTVIGGDNNTGKSTIGKVLYSIFRGTSDITRRIKEERIKAVREIFAAVTKMTISDDDCARVMGDSSQVRPVLFKLLDNDFIHDQKVEQASPVKAFIDSFESRVRSRIEAVLSMPSDRVAWIILKRVFECVFHGQYHPLKTDIPPAELCLEVRGRVNTMQFRYDCAELTSTVDLFAHAILLTDPNAMSYVNIKDFDSNPAYTKILDKYVYELVLKLMRDDSKESGILKEQRRDLIESVLGQLDGMILGTLKSVEQGDLALHEQGNGQATKVQNLSMGMKALLLLRTMLSKGILSERDVLILDEPENHLHPEWQVFYARTLIQIQKAYNLSMVVTSHSQFFINALQRFVISEGMSEKTHFYLTKQDPSRPGYCTVEDRGSSASGIVRSFNLAYERMSVLSGELHEPDNASSLDKE